MFYIFYTYNSLLIFYRQFFPFVPLPRTNGRRIPSHWFRSFHSLIFFVLLSLFTTKIADLVWLAGKNKNSVRVTWIKIIYLFDFSFLFNNFSASSASLLFVQPLYFLLNFFTYISYLFSHDYCL